MDSIDSFLLFSYLAGYKKNIKPVCVECSHCGKTNIFHLAKLDCKQCKICGDFICNKCNNDNCKNVAKKTRL